MRTTIMAMSSAVLAAAALSLAGTVPASARPVSRSRPDATTVCGTSCFDLSNSLLGPARIQQLLVGGIHLLPGKTALLTQDFSNIQVGTLGGLCGQPGGIVPTAYVCLNFAGSLPVFQWVYSPYGNPTGLCESAAKAALNQHVILLPCGTPPNRDLWVYDYARSVGPGTSCLTGRYCPWYNVGSVTGYPVVLKVKNAGGQLILAAAGSATPAGKRKQFCIRAGPFFVPVPPVPPVC